MTIFDAVAMASIYQIRCQAETIEEFEDRTIHLPTIKAISLEDLRRALAELRYWLCCDEQGEDRSESRDLIAKSEVARIFDGWKFDLLKKLEEGR